MKPKADSPDSGGKPAPLRVGVIDDDRIMRILLEKLISKQDDLELCGVWDNGEDALAALHTLRPDVVMVDLELPGISGEDCIRTLSVNLPCTGGTAQGLPA